MSRDARSRVGICDYIREAHHAALLEILDAEQEEIWVLHAALRGSFARQATGPRGGFGRDAGFGGDGSGDGESFGRRRFRGT